MRYLTLPEKWGVCWYVAFVLAGTVLGEVVYFIWPQLFLFWLQLESFAWFVAAIVVGALTILVLGRLLRRLKLPGSTRHAGAALWGLGLVVVSIAVLLFAAWNIAELMDWPTAP